jgi:hypothetical protein
VTLIIDIVISIINENHIRLQPVLEYTGSSPDRKSVPKLARSLSQRRSLQHCLRHMRVGRLSHCCGSLILCLKVLCILDHLPAGLSIFHNNVSSFQLKTNHLLLVFMPPVHIIYGVKRLVPYTVSVIIGKGPTWLSFSTAGC